MKPIVTTHDHAPAAPEKMDSTQAQVCANQCSRARDGKRCNTCIFHGHADFHVIDEIAYQRATQDDAQGLTQEDAAYNFYSREIRSLERDLASTKSKLRYTEIQLDAERNFFNQQRTELSLKLKTAEKQGGIWLFLLMLLVSVFGLVLFVGGAA